MHDDNQDKGRKSLRWTPEIPEAGEYEIVFHFLPNGNRATNVAVTVDVAGETDGGEDRRDEEE